MSGRHDCDRELFVMSQNNVSLKQKLNMSGKLKENFLRKELKRKSRIKDKNVRQTAA